VKMGKKLCNLLNCELPFDDISFQLVELAEEQGWDGVLVAEILAARSDKAEVVEFVKRRAPAVLKPTASGTLTAQVRVGLEAVVGILNEPKVQEILWEYRARLERAREGITALNQYKKLHDVLHTLQQQLEGKLVPLADEARKGAITSDVDT